MQLHCKGDNPKQSPVPGLLRGIYIEQCECARNDNFLFAFTRVSSKDHFGIFNKNCEQLSPIIFVVLLHDNASYVTILERARSETGCKARIEFDRVETRIRHFGFCLYRLIRVRRQKILLGQIQSVSSRLVSFKFILIKPG